MTSIVKAELGSWEWLCETGGSLTARQRVELLPGLLRTFGQFVGDRLWLALGRRRSLSLSVHDLWPVAPDSSICHRADEEARELQSAPLVNHAYRTWVFGSALAMLDEARLDREVFHVGSLLHDAGIETCKEAQCFTYRSAEAAQTVAREVAFDEQRTLQIMDGIANHITPGLRKEDQSVGYYLQAGAMADLMGLRAWELPSELLSRTEERFPRLNVHREVSQRWLAESKAVPSGRAHYAQAWSGFAYIVRFLPVAK